MGIFTRFKEIINSNINSMLDNAEDPEKLIKLMIREMEDTLIEIRTSCAGAIASRKKTERQLDAVLAREKDWENKARVAVAKGRDDLAREALKEKRVYTQKAESLREKVTEHDAIVAQYQEDIRQLDDKLRGAREKQRVLIQRHIRASRKKRAQEDIRRMDSSEVVIRFDELENRIEQMEAEADMVNFGRKPGLEEELANLESDDEIEAELRSLKKDSLGSKDDASVQTPK